MNHDEAVAFREDKKAAVLKGRNEKPGKTLECNLLFAEVAETFLAYQKPRLTPKA